MAPSCRDLEAAASRFRSLDRETPHLDSRAFTFRVALGFADLNLRGRSPAGIETADSTRNETKRFPRGKGETKPSTGSSTSQTLLFRCDKSCIRNETIRPSFPANEPGIFSFLPRLLASPDPPLPPFSYAPLERNKQLKFQSAFRQRGCDRNSLDFDPRRDSSSPRLKEKKMTSRG